MSEIGSYSPTYDYSSIGSMGSDAVQSVNGDIINKIRAAEEESIIMPLVEDIDNITLETEKLEEIKSKVTELSDVVEYFDLYNDENIFRQYHFDVSGSSAVFDAVDVADIEPGNISVSVSQLAQKDVFQSKTFEGIDLNSSFTEFQDPSDSLQIQVGNGEVFTIEAFDDDGEAKTYSEFVQDINEIDGVQASWEVVGTNSSDENIYRLILKSTEPGTSNSLNLTQNGNLDLGLDTGNVQVNSSVVDGTDVPTIGQKITLNAIDSTPVDFTFNGESIETMVDTINSHSDFNASINDDNEIEITMSDGSEVTVSTDVTGLSFNGENLNHLLHAQNLKATVDGVEYDVSSNELTFQNGIKMTALKEDDPGESSSVTISRDTSAISIAIETMLTKYNEVVEMVNEELNDTNSVIQDKDSLRTILDDLKTMLFQSYGADSPTFGTETDKYDDQVLAHSNVTNNDKSIFLFGVELDKSGMLSLNTETLNNILSGDDENYNFEDIRNVFTGVYENKGLGVQMKEYLESLESYDGVYNKYEEAMESRKEDLEEEKEEELERLDAKYGIMAQQFSEYSAVIAQMESSFSGLKMMIEQETSGS